MSLLVDLVAIGLVLVAIYRISVSDTDKWAHGARSKTGWILLTLWLAWPTRFGVLPVGAMWAIWKTHRLYRRPHRRSQDGLDVPFVDGIPVPFERPKQESHEAEEQS